jgi:putative heme iron utilization protein
MDNESLNHLAHLVRSQRVASLGTLRDGAPGVAMVLYAVTPDLSVFYLHLSRLAHHTQNIKHDHRVALMIAEQDRGAIDPQSLRRVTIQSTAMMLDHESSAHEDAAKLYLSRFPEAQMSFSLGDFNLYRIEPVTARFIAGFGQIFNLTAADFRAAGESV